MVLLSSLLMQISAHQAMVLCDWSSFSSFQMLVPPPLASFGATLPPICFATAVLPTSLMGEERNERAADDAEVASLHVACDKVLPP